MDRVAMLAATEADVPATAQCAAAAFAADPLMHFFFGGSPMGVPAASARFFELLMRARLALGMPALVARRNNAIVGVAMGYDAAPPDWPREHARAWEAFELEIPGVPERFAEYQRIAERFRPESPHYYLGVLGVDPALKGKGLGKALLNAFCARSSADAASTGVYLETASPESLAFYLRNGFVVAGEDALGPVRLCCLFRPDAACQAGAAAPT